MTGGEHDNIKEKPFSGDYSESSFSSVAGGPVRYAVRLHDKSRGMVIVVSGRTEFVEKYAELATDFWENGYSVCLYDHFGQGKSGRDLADHQKGHIQSFDIYVKDLQFLIEEIILPACSSPVYLLAHSMGGTVGADYVSRFPGTVDGMILCSPMLQIFTGRLLKPFLAEAVSGVMCFMGFAEHYCWGTGPFDPQQLFEKTPLTTDRKRFLANLDLARSCPSLQLGGPTFRWLYEAYRAMRKARKSGGNITCPVLVMGGSEDRVVSFTEIKKFCKSLKKGRMKSYIGARHELLMEHDRYRDDVIAEILQFIAAL